MRVRQKRGDKGSLKRVQHLVNDQCPMLDKVVDSAIASPMGVEAGMKGVHEVSVDARDIT
jgi:hypothetical protein